MVKFLQFRDFDDYRTSAWALVAANALPLFGVLFLGWDAFSIVILYWSENVIIGAINVLKMITCRPGDELLILGDVDPNDKLNRARMERSRGQSVKLLRLANDGSKLFFVPFFIIHYGGFCFVHGVLIFAIFGREAGGFGPFGGFDNLLHVFTNEHLWWCVAALAASHLWSFAVNYLRRGEYRRSSVPVLMFQPYARIVILHVAILIGGFIAAALGSNVVVLLILIVGKTLLDLSLHLAERQRNATAAISQPSIMPDRLPGEEEAPHPTRAASER
ncbi:MAG TPA: DUF6498-containing protein [Lacipirellulaceae bacterium]|nr:DUF6498-containing protein [Lacipirellulaceae bacterium]